MHWANWVAVRQIKKHFTIYSQQMKSIFTILLSISFNAVLTIHAQPMASGKITGTVVDSLTRKPVEFANIALAKADAATPIDGTVCDEKGKFTITKVQAGAYKVIITFIGFQSRTISIQIREDQDEVALGTIILSPSQQVLKEILVEGQKAIIEERVDRTVYNAENDATTKGGDATDVLKRVPMLSVDLDGNVTLRGNQNILVLINNKPSTIMAGSIPDALKQIPADQIKSVEVITSPSAKYDAEGSAGIINIITKKNTLHGVTLNVDAGAGLRGSNLGLNGNYRKGKMGFSLGGFGRASYNVNGNFENQQSTLDTITSDRTLNLQRADTRNSGLFGHYNLGWDYDIDKKNFLAASVRFGLRNQNNYQDNLTTERYLNDERTSFTEGLIRTKDESNNVDVNFTYTHLYDKPQKELSFQGMYSRNNRDNNFENIQETSSTFPYTKFKNLNDSYNQEVTVQADYVSPINSNQMIEFGAKDIMRKVISDYQSFQAIGEDGAYTSSSDDRFSNNLNYDQNVMAAYASYTYTSKKAISIKAGSRYEYTTITAYSRTDDNIEIPSYGLLVPSINISKKLKNGNTLKASYNKRIQRPSIRFLNPNIQPTNNLNVTIGNPQLDPEYTNNYELSYSTLLKGLMVNVSTFARNTRGAIQSVRGPGEIDGEQKIITTFQNIGMEDAYGTSIFLNINLGKLSLNGGGDVYYLMLDNNIAEKERHASNKGWVASGRMFGSYNLNKGWGFQFFGFYRGRQVQLQGTQGGFYIYSLALRKEFNEKRGSIGFGAENFLQRNMKIKTKLESPLLDQQSVNVMNNVSFKVNISYRIGKMSMEAPRRRRSINNDDMKDGGGDNMNMSDGSTQQRGGGQIAVGGMPRNQVTTGQRNQNEMQNTSGTSMVRKDTTASTIYEATGTWTYTIDSPQGGAGKIDLKNENGVYTGTIINDRMKEETALTNIRVAGNDVSFSYPVNFGGNSAVVEVHYKVINNDIQGTLNIGAVRSFKLTGKRSN
jgi:outer membrane receptor protein involved in Fe transport